MAWEEVGAKSISFSEKFPGVYFGFASFTYAIMKGVFNVKLADRKRDGIKNVLAYVTLQTIVGIGQYRLLKVIFKIK